MRRRTIHGVALGVLLLSLLSTAPAVEARSTSDRLSETRRQLRAARARLYRARQTDAQLEATIGVISRQLSRVQSRLAGLRTTVARLEAKIASAERHLAKIETRRAAYAEAFGIRARTLYIMGPAGVETWLGSASFSDFIGRTTNMDFVSRFDRRSLERLADIRHEETRLRRSLRSERARVARMRDQVAEEASVVADGLTTQREAESRLAQHIAEYRSEVQALAAEESRIVALILARSSAYTGGAVSRKGFAWPIRGPITSGYGPRWGSFHTGIDIDCRTGDPIGASKAGTVIASEWGGGYGWMTIIDHGGGVTTLYAHQSTLIARQGERVRQRQVIGRCGATGNATGDHLHFEVRVNGRHQNPRNFLP